MPLMGGRELAEQLVQRHPETKVLYTSGYTDDVIIRQGTLASLVEFMPKPFTPSSLSHRVREVIEKKI